VLFEIGAIDGIGGTETMFKRRASTNVSQLGLHHRPQVTGRVVAEVDDLAGLAFENDHHAASYLRCRNSHIIEFSV
jgi:hypothetical protein